MAGARIVYFSFPDGERFTGGQRMLVWHVRTLAEAGFDAVLRLRPGGPAPAWAQGACPTERGDRFFPGEAVVAPDDAPNAITALAQAGARPLVFCQNHLQTTLWGLPDAVLGQVAGFLACSRTVAASLQRCLPGAPVTVTPAFVDPAFVRPAPEASGSPPPARRWEVALTPAKRPREAAYVQAQLPRVRPGAQPAWTPLQGAATPEVAEAFARAPVFLSLARFEGLGLTALEAMASGCVVAGFTGVGGREYATPANGFWAPDDDLEAATDALAAALDLAAAGGPALEAVISQGRLTAARYGEAAARAALLAFWTRTAPHARR